VSVVVTGAAGFIGMHVAARLLARGEAVVGMDNLTPYYDPALKRARLRQLQSRPGFSFVELDVAEPDRVLEVLQASRADRVVHLAAQAGVRHSIDHPFLFERANVAGHLAVLEACRATPAVKHLVYASSSSVYGERPLGGTGFSEADPVDEPASLYAATKRACELMSGTYVRLYGLKATGLRFFSVYGPWGRPDMAYFSFTQKILAGEPIQVFGEGRMARDFTYVDDVAAAVVGVLDAPPARPEHRVFNVGAGRPIALLDMIAALEKAIGRGAEKLMLPMQPGDVSATFADVSRLRASIGYEPKVGLELGLERFVEWYRDYQAENSGAAAAPPA